MRSVLHLLLAYSLVVAPGFAKAASAPPQVLLEQVQLVHGGRVQVGVKPVFFLHQVSPDWGRSLIELFAPVAPKSGAVPDKEPDQKREQRKPGTLEQFQKDHPVLSNVLFAIVAAMAGFAIGGGFGGGR